MKYNAPFFNYCSLLLGLLPRLTAKGKGKAILKIVLSL